MGLPEAGAMTSSNSSPISRALVIGATALLLLRRLISGVDQEQPSATAGPRADCARAADLDAIQRAAEVRERRERRSAVVYLIRHAQSESNAAKSDFHNGRHLEVPLSALGRRQARALGTRIARCGVAFDRVFASTADRAQETARIALAGAAAVEIVEGIEEVAMGGWTGRRKAECATPAASAARERDAWEWRPPGRCAANGLLGESYRDVEERMVRFLNERVLRPSPSPAAAADAASSPITVAVFTHHCAIRCCLRSLLESSPLVLSPKLGPKNTSITELRYDADSTGRRGGWRVVRINDAAHLEGLEYPIP